MKKIIVLMVAMVSSVLAMAISAPSNLRWEDGDLTFYWDNDPDAEYATYTLDGVQRGFLYYKACSYSPDPLLLSPGFHTFCVYCADAKLNCSDWSCITIEIEDTIPPLEHPTPAEPFNLTWQVVNTTDVMLSWEADASIHTFGVFLDDRVVSYETNSHDYTYVNLSPGVHKLGVSSMDDDGYVSDQVYVVIQHNMQQQPTVMLPDAYWGFESTQTALDGQQTLTDNENAEYAYHGTSATLIQGRQGEMAYLILPVISDVQTYDSLELTLKARGGYWSSLSHLWAHMADGHRLQVGSLPYIPLPADMEAMIEPILDMTLPYANISNFEDYEADSLYFWRDIRVPLVGAQPYIVIYAQCTTNNYVVIDEVRISKIASDTPDAEKPSDEMRIDEYFHSGSIGVEKVLRNGQVLIMRGERVINAAGQIVR